MRKRSHFEDSTTDSPVRQLYPFACPNCDAAIVSANLYCSEACRQEGKLVRYARACYADGRIDDPEVAGAIEIRIAFALGGGYPEQARRLTPATRKFVFERDKGRCQVCGEEGSEIDHISSSSSDLDNLQVICEDCHDEKTRASLRRITKESDPELWERLEVLRERIHAERPVRECDAELWTDRWRDVKAARQRILKERGTA